ncbi:MAG: UbiX family flavin prenyltransferase [Oligoflexales bacterium]|nr:UbiX family flavin prenyltransferase [Oligoflexales bacterium]
MSITREEKRIVVGITGASGAIYANRLIEELLARVARVYCIATDAGRQVCDYELNGSECTFNLKKTLAGEVAPEYRQTLRIFDHNDLFSPIASGSSAPSHVVIVPCSMGSLARISSGMSSNLLERSADVALKQKIPLIICPRETPFNTIHLQNLLNLSQMGVHIVPMMPAFYQKPKTINDLVDFMVGRILELLGLEHKLYVPWNSRMR